MNSLFTTLDDLARTASHALAGERSTEELRAAAQALVDAREHFHTKTGDTDWTGRSHAYRQWVRDVYATARVPAEDLTRVQTAVRYHVNNIIHDRLDPETLESIGLRAESTRERSMEQRAQKSDTLRLVEPGAPFKPEDMPAVARILADMARRIDPETLKGLSNGERAPITEALAIVAEKAVGAGKRPRRS